MGSIADYEIGSVLLRVSTGIVYSGIYRRTNHAVALEQISSDLVHTPGFVERLSECGQQAAKFRHPSAVSIYDLAEKDHTLYVVTERIAGRPLRAVVPKGQSLDPIDSMIIIDDLLGVLEAAHQHGILHGDIRPEAVLVDDNGQSKLGWFAISLALATVAEAPSWRRAVYPTPERLQNGKIEASDDLYAIASLAHELMTGATPGANDTQIPASFKPVLDKALDKNLNKRYGSAHKLRQAMLESAVKNFGTTWRLESALKDIKAPLTEPKTVMAAETNLKAADKVKTSEASLAARAQERSITTPVLSRATLKAGKGATIAPISSSVKVPGLNPQAAERARQAQTSRESRQRRALTEEVAIASTKLEKTGKGGWKWLLALVLLIGAVTGAFFTYSAISSSTVSNSGPLLIHNDVAISAQPQRGSCNTTFNFVTTGSLSGSGQIVFRWEQSDGTITSDTVANVSGDKTGFRFTQSWRLEGKRPAAQSMTFHLLKPIDRTVQQPLTYSCP